MQIRDLPGSHIVRVPVPAAWATAGTAGDFPAFVAPFDGQVVAARLVADAAITGHATNYATLAVNKGATVLASRATDTPTDDDVAALGTFALTLNATEASRRFTEGDVIDIEKTVTASGVAVSGIIEVEFQSRG